jgi:hypothetical protein
MLIYYTLKGRAPGHRDSGIQAGRSMLASREKQLTLPWRPGKHCYSFQPKFIQEKEYFALNQL